MSFSNIAFASYLQYAPHGTTAKSRVSKDITLAVKNDAVTKTQHGQQRVIPYAARRLAESAATTPWLGELFAGNVTLVPVPRSAPLGTGWLWPAMKLCQAIVAAGLGTVALPLLVRTVAVPKSATARPGQRPGPATHLDSLAVDGDLPWVPSGGRIVIVDDVVTRGATLLGCHARLTMAYPGASVSCFGLIRTVRGEVETFIDPVRGTIAYMGETYLVREP